MTKNVFLILLLLLPAFLAAETSSEPVRLGVTVPLTGDYASYGDLINKGVELAAEDLRAEGHLVEIKSEDACIPSQAVSSIHKLIALDRIQILAANFCILAIPAMAPILERNQIISFHTATASDSILASGEFIFATNGRFGMKRNVWPSMRITPLVPEQQAFFI
jgi:branched-chain amino acid transport system substrate-binding protein